MSTETNIPARNNLAIASLILGILGVIIELAFLFNGMEIGALIGVVAIILGIVALGQIKRTHSAGKGAAITGIVLGSLAFVVLLVLVLMAPILGKMVNGLIG